MTPDKGIYPLRILRILQEFTDSERSVSAQEIQERLTDIHGKKPCSNTIRANIKRLRHEGFKIIRKDGKYANYYLADRTLTYGEVIAICDQIHSSFFISAEESQKLIKKLLGFLPTHLRSQHLKQYHNDNKKKTLYNNLYFENYMKFCHASERHIALDVVYRSRVVLNGSELHYTRKRHTLYPAAVISNANFSYLIAFIKGKDNEGRFRIDRFDSVEFLDEPFPSDWDYEYYDHYDMYCSPYMFGGEKLNAQFICDMHIFQAVADVVGHDARFYQLPDDPEKFYLSFKASRDDILLFTQQFMEWVTLLSPDDIRDEFEARCSEVLRKSKEYSSKE